MNRYKLRYLMWAMLSAITRVLLIASTMCLILSLFSRNLTNSGSCCTLKIETVMTA